VSSVDAHIVAEFTKADSRNTLRGWDQFLDKYVAYPGNALVGVAQNKRGLLQEEADARQAEKDRKPWLIPAAGLNGHSIELTLAERKLVQKALSYMGFDIGSIDGQFGPNTNRAISAARFSNGLPPGTNINRDLLKLLPNVPAVDALMSQKAKIFKVAEFPPDIEPRLRRALGVLTPRKLKFAYFRGHLYIAVLDTAGWNYSNVIAKNAGGHLVTLSNAQENRFVYELFSNDKRFIKSFSDGYLHGPSIGLHQVDRRREPFGGWAWVTGEPMVYKNWSTGNPDNFKKRQHYGSFFRSKSQRNRVAGPIHWDDTSGFSNSFIIEIE